jgi:hypothetical protein
MSRYVQLRVFPVEVKAYQKYKEHKSLEQDIKIGYLGLG